MTLTAWSSLALLCSIGIASATTEEIVGGVHVKSLPAAWIADIHPETDISETLTSKPTVQVVAAHDTPNMALLNHHRQIDAVMKVIKVNNTEGSSGHASADAQQKLTPRSWFAITFSAAFALKGACMMSTVASSVSPIPQVKTFWSKHDTGEVDAAPFISIMYGGAQWCFYGSFAFIVTRKSGFLVLVYSNIFGAVLGTYYTYAFFNNVHLTNTKGRLFFYLRAVSCIAFVQLCVMLALPREQSLFFCGLVSSVCSIVGALSLLATMPVVLERKCSDTISRPILAAGVMGNILWLACGIMLWDEWICVPNIVGLCANSVAVGLVLKYPQSGDKGEDISIAQFLSTVKSMWGSISHRLPVLSPSENIRHAADAADEAEAAPYAGYDTAEPRQAIRGESYTSYGALGETGGTF